MPKKKNDFIRCLTCLGAMNLNISFNKLLDRERTKSIEVSSRGIKYLISINR